jgi:anti-sigma regulatory factor (Ser/Thr protein kinase)
MASELIEPARVLLPFAPVGVGMARRQMAADLTALGVAQARLDDAQVVLSELMANSVRHARPLSSGRLLASWQLDARGITVSVTDGGGATTPTPLNASPLAMGGRGLAIVEELSLEWGVRIEDHATTVYATLAS